MKRFWTILDSNSSGITEKRRAIFISFFHIIGESYQRREAPYILDFAVSVGKLTEKEGENTDESELCCGAFLSD